MKIIYSFIAILSIILIIIGEFNDDSMLLSIGMSLLSCNIGVCLGQKYKGK